MQADELSYYRWAPKKLERSLCIRVMRGNFKKLSSSSVREKRDGREWCILYLITKPL